MDQSLDQQLLSDNEDGQDSALQLALGIGDLVAPRGDDWGGQGGGARNATTAGGSGKRRVKRR